MLRAWSFQFPTRIDFGPGRLRKVGQTAAAWGRTILLVGYQTPLEHAAPRTNHQNVAASGSSEQQAGEALLPVYATVRESLEAAGLTVIPFAQVAPNPDAPTVAAGARLAVDAGADLVVAVGGGSVIDAGKAIALVAAGQAALEDCTEANRRSRPATEALPLLAVPTTAGTGAEATSLAIITQRGIGAMPEAPLKTTVYGPALAPRVALVDPTTTWTCPARLTAACGADALGHAIEACMSRRANPLATSLAERAAALVVAHLRRAVDSPEDAEAREALSLAALLAGMAIESAGVTLGHSLAHALGALLGVPHGEAVALATPLNLRYNAAESVEPCARLALACGLDGKTPEERAGRFAACVDELLGSLGLLEPVRVPHESSAVLAPRLAQNAMDGTLPPLRANPRSVDRPQLEELFHELLRTARGKP